MPFTPKQLIIHHSAGSHGSVQIIREQHVLRNGWKDIGYHDVIGNGNGQRDGEIKSGRSHTLQGAGVALANANRLHVCLIGNFELTEPTPKQIASLGHWLHTNLRRYGIKPGADTVMGHCQAALKGHETACPGRHLIRRLDAIRAWCADQVTHERPTQDLAAALGVEP